MRFVSSGRCCPLRDVCVDFAGHAATITPHVPLGQGHGQLTVSGSSEGRLAGPRRVARVAGRAAPWATDRDRLRCLASRKVKVAQVTARSSVAHSCVGLRQRRFDSSLADGPRGDVPGASVRLLSGRPSRGE